MQPVTIQLDVAAMAAVLSQELAKHSLDIGQAACAEIVTAMVQAGNPQPVTIEVSVSAGQG